MTVVDDKRCRVSDYGVVPVLRFWANALRDSGSHCGRMQVSAFGECFIISAFRLGLGIDANYLSM